MQHNCTIIQKTGAQRGADTSKSINYKPAQYIRLKDSMTLVRQARKFVKKYFCLSKFRSQSTYLCILENHVTKQEC